MWKYNSKSVYSQVEGYLQQGHLYLFRGDLFKKRKKISLFSFFYICTFSIFALLYYNPFKKSMALECGSLSNLNRNLLYILINLNSDIDRSLLLNFVQRFVWEKRKIRIYQNVLHHLCSVSDNFVIAAIRHV